MTEKVEESHSYLTREIPGLLCLFLAVTLFLALISFHPKDPSFSTFSTETGRANIQNFIGLAGAYASALFIDFLGLAAFWPVLAVIGVAMRFFQGRPYKYPVLFWTGAVLLLLSSSVALTMLFPRLTLFWPQTPGGGLLGDFLTRHLIEVLNPVGAALLTGVLVLLSIILATGFSIIRSTVAFFRGMSSVKKKVDAAHVKHKEKAERAKKRKQQLAKQKKKTPPKILEKPEKNQVEPKKEPELPIQEVFEFSKLDGPYRLPPVDLLDEPEKNKSGMSKDSLTANARLLEKKLNDFNVEGEVVEVTTGPVITMYEYKPAPGVKISKVAGLSDDLALNMRALSIRIVAPLPGKAAIGIEIPNPKREFVYLNEVISSTAFNESDSVLSLVMGVDIMGEPEIADLGKMPHLLIAGATGSGKSVGLNAIIMSILFKAEPEQVKFLMIDPKRIELTPYRDLPHLIYPVVTEPKEANMALRWAVTEMERRYRLLAEKGVRNIETYNRKVKKELAKWKPAPPKPSDNGAEAKAETIEEQCPPELLPYLVIIIDELADLMMVSPKEVESSITRLAQMARAAGIHLILATQRPSVDVLTGVIKANMPTRVSFQVSSKIDSRTILDAVGSEKLLGMGDMLYMPPGTGKIRRIHGAFVSDAEIKRVTDYIKAQRPPDYMDELAVDGGAGEAEEGESEYDEKYDEAVELVTKTRKASISLVQRHLRIGYNRAARIIETMEKEGVVGPADGAKPREVLVPEL